MTALLRKNEQQSAMCIVQRYDRQNLEFNVQEIPTPQLHRRPMSYKVKLNEWWCDCREFQTPKLPFPYVIVVSPVYSLNNIPRLMKYNFIQFRTKIIGFFTSVQI